MACAGAAYAAGTRSTLASSLGRLWSFAVRAFRADASPRISSRRCAAATPGRKLSQQKTRRRSKTLVPSRPHNKFILYCSLISAYTIKRHLVMLYAPQSNFAHTYQPNHPVLGAASAASADASVLEGSGEVTKTETSLTASWCKGLVLPLFCASRRHCSM